ncbi:MAG: hypothetical protein LBQ50_02000 [Planctomycetaceae bacterium]|nr:hypothetical protein [Planctomycetaceae bacterium]
MMHNVASATKIELMMTRFVYLVFFVCFVSQKKIKISYPKNCVLEQGCLPCLLETPKTEQ